MNGSNKKNNILIFITVLIQSKVKVSYRVIRINDILFFIFKVEDGHIYQWILGGF
jgi:hypothetical protein